jgi:hypothetical protein
VLRARTAPNERAQNANSQGRLSNRTALPEDCSRAAYVAPWVEIGFAVSLGAMKGNFRSAGVRLQPPVTNDLGCGFGRHKAVYGLHQLPVRLVRNCNHVQQHLILIQFALVNMERAECADLKYPRLLN